MRTSIPRLARSLTRTLLLAAALAGLGVACDSDSITGPRFPTGSEVGVVLNSIDRTLTMFRVDAPDDMFTIGLGFDGSPVTMDVHEETVAVPLGTIPAVAVVDLLEEIVLDVIELPDNSGATGIAFVNDSIAFVANPNLDSVSPVNVRRATVEPEIRVGMFPTFVVADGDRAYVVNAELDDAFDPARRGTISVIDVPSRTVIETIELTGLNPNSAVLGSGGRLFVVNSGRFGDQDGSLSVVSTAALEEVEHHGGFDDFPVGSAFGPDGLVYVTSTQYGVAIWDPDAREFVRDPQTPLTPGGAQASAGIEFDSMGRLYGLELECSALADVFRLSATFTLERTIEVGVCPIDIAFTVPDPE